MGMLIYFIVFIALLFGVYFLAKLIINKVPRKLHWIISLILIVISAYLGYLIYTGIVCNINFHEEKARRYEKVIDQLKIINKAEKDFYKAKGDYTTSFDKLIKFIETDSFAITHTYQKEVEYIRRGVKEKKSVKQVDTVGYTQVSTDYKNIPYKEMMNIPFTSDKFELKKGIVTKTGVVDRKIPVFEARASKAKILEGMEAMNKKLLKQELAAVSIDEVKGEYISVGSLEVIKDGGNWPLMYDTEEENTK
jgi:hypothetical protein